jgi:hypothetical protein
MMEITANGIDDDGSGSSGRWSHARSHVLDVGPSPSQSSLAASVQPAAIHLS